MPSRFHVLALAAAASFAFNMLDAGANSGAFAQTAPEAQQQANPAAQPSIVTPVTPKSTISTQQFRRLALMARFFDYESGRLAGERSRRRPVRAYALSIMQNFRTDFTRLTAGAGAFSGLPTSLPSDLDAPVTPFVDDRRAKMLNQLSAAEGPAFDRLFMDIQAGVQDETQNLYATYIQSGDDPNLLAYARDMLPVIQAHFQKARRMAR